MNVAGLILAAGQSRRMGDTNKLLKPWHGKPLLTHVLEASFASELMPLVVVTGHQAELVQPLVGEHAEVVFNPNHDMGMASSLVAGFTYLSNLQRDLDGVLVLLGDMPLVSKRHIAEIMKAFEAAGGDEITVASNEGEAGNPVLFPKRLFDGVLTVEGDRGARHMVMQEQNRLVKVEIGRSASMDFDTPEAFKS